MTGPKRKALLRGVLALLASGAAAFFLLRQDNGLSGGSVASSAVDKLSGKASASNQAPDGSPRRPPLHVVCVSDTHGHHMQKGLIKVPPGGLLLFAGDAGLSTPAEGAAFNAWLADLPISGPRVVTWGNMDTATREGEGPAMVPAATVIVNFIQEVHGYRIFASPWTPRFAGAYQLEAEGPRLDEYWAALLPPGANVDIILTHGPPFGIADTARGIRRGDPGLLKAVQALVKPPLLWVCGHIHEQYGEFRVPHERAPDGGILLLNAAVFYANKPGHEERAQPRVVKLPEAVLLPRK